MSIIRKAEQLIVDDINAKNTLDLTVDQVEFLDPRRPATEDELFYAGELNTVVTVVAKEGAPGLGKCSAYYDRVDLATIFTGPDGANPLVIPVDIERTLTAKDTVPSLNYYRGFEFTEADLEPYLVNSQNLTVNIQATPGSLGWTGSVTAKLLPGGPHLAPNFPVTDGIRPYNYPYYNVKLGSASVYSYPYKFDDYAAEFLAAGTSLPLDRLAAILKAVTGHSWEVWRMPSEYNLKEAVVSYNGINRTDLPSNPMSQYVMVVDLSLYCINIGGKLLIHYSDLS